MALAEKGGGPLEGTLKPRKYGVPGEGQLPFLTEPNFGMGIHNESIRGVAGPDRRASVGCGAYECGTRPASNRVAGDRNTATHLFRGVRKPA